MISNHDALPTLPEHVATLGKDGSPRHVRHVWGALESKLHGEEPKHG